MTRRFQTLRPGPSPRARGAGRLLGRLRRPVGFIPAGAGSSGSTPVVPRPEQVHPPRVQEAVCRGGVRPDVDGSIPAVRGQSDENRASGRDVGSIPAGAGSGSPNATSPSTTWVHPYVCGGQREQLHHQRRFARSIPAVRGQGLRRSYGTVASGPSPRAREAGGDGVPHFADARSIPAGAGSSLVHPRVRSKANLILANCNERRNPVFHRHPCASDTPLKESPPTSRAEGRNVLADNPHGV